MASHSNIRHRRAAAVAAQRRAPNPQLGFNPTAVFTDPGDVGPTGIFGGLSDFFPQRPTPSISDDLPLSSSSSSSSTTSSSSSSSSTSSSSSVSSSSTTSSSSSSTFSTTSTTPTPTKLSLTTAPVQTAVVTVSISRTSSLTSSAPTTSSTSDSADASGGMSTGAVVGGIGAGVVAIAVIGFAVAYFIRRSRKRETEGPFDSGNFRRSAVLIDDPPTHDDTVSHGFNPPPMVERYNASPAPTFGTQYGHPGPAGYGGEEQYDQYGAGGYAADNRAGYGAAAPYQSFQPGQVMNANSAMTPISATSAHPMYANPAYAQNPFSPIHSLPDEYRDQNSYHYNNNGHQSYEYPQADPAFPAPVTVPQPVLTRQPSASAAQYPNPNPHADEPHADEPHRPTPLQLKRESAPANDYVDLNRSSVSPYQAAQYVEISRRLNSDVPAGLATADVERELPMPPPPIAGSGNNSPSPFADPSTPRTPGGGQYAIDRRYSGDADTGAGAEPQALDFPAPPSPVHTPTSASRYRIDSMPPTLPEIHVEARVSVSSVGMGGLAAQSQAQSQGGLTTGTRSQFPTTPSPLASSFGFPSPAPDATTFSDPKHPAIPAATTPTAPPSAYTASTPTHKKQASMQSVYNADDAYGGF